MSNERAFRGRQRRIAVVAAVCATFAGLAAFAVARPLTGGPGVPQIAAGSGTFTYITTKLPITAFGPVVATGTVTTRTIPAAIKPGEPVRFIVETRFVETYEKSPCPFEPGADPGSSNVSTRFPLSWIRPGHGEDILDAGRVHDIDGTMTTRGFNAQTSTCGPPRITRVTSYDTRMTGAQTAGLSAGCYAHALFGIGLLPLPPETTYAGTFATLSVGGVDCTSGGTAAAVPVTAFADTFSTAGQAKPHAVAVPAAKTKAELTLRWTKPGDRFTIADVVLVPKRKTASVGRAEKLKITFFSVTPTSMGVRIGNLAPGKLMFRVVSKKLSGTTTVRTRVILKA